jgi:hypothetical protein
VLAGATAFFGAVADAHATDDPSLAWYTYETQHFKVTYPEPLDAIARRVATLSETIYVRLTEDMQFTPSDKTEILLTDDSDFANGNATPAPYDAIRLFVTAPDDVSTLGDYDDWYLGLVTHEYTHILHTGNISGAAAIANRIIGRTLAPNSAQPRWIIEGLAVVQESDHTSGGRIRSTLFDTYLRADVLEDDFARLDQISSGAQRWPYGNLYYLYGSRFLRWIADVYGKDTFTAISADYGASTIPFGINRAIQRVTGRTYEELYDAWLEHLRMHYGDMKKAVDARGRREGARITFHGRNASYPWFVPKAHRRDASADELVYFRDDGSERSGLYRMTLGDPKTAGERNESLVVRTTTDTTTSFTPEGDLFLSDMAYWQNQYSRHDLFVVDHGDSPVFGTESSRHRLTEGLRAAEADVAPDGKHVVFTVDSRGTRTLMIAERTTEGALVNRRPLLPSRPFDQVYTPRWSPDGRKVAFSAWQAGGFRDVRVIEVSTGTVTDITHDRSLDVGPTWSPDGKTLYFSSDRTGIFDVYAFDTATQTLQMVTNVVGAALMPAVSPDGKTLAYVGYTHEGFDLFAMPLDPSKFLDAPEPPQDRDAPPPEPDSIALERHAYNPLPTLGPRTYLLSIGQGAYATTAVTFKTTMSDLVGHHTVDAAVQIDPGAPEPRVDVDYTYSGLPVDLSASFTRRTLPRSNGLRANNTDIGFDETQTSFQATAGLPIRSAYVDQAFSLAYQPTFFAERSELPQRLDPDSTVTIRPTDGFLSQFRLQYGISAIEGATDAAGAKRGVSFRIGTTLADHDTGSDESLYVVDASASAYIPMPWPGEQTLALRASGGVSAGTYARRGLFFVGGYDLENNSIFDTVFSGRYDGSFVLRGYAPSAYAGSEFLLSTLEYRAPIFRPNWGPGTTPIFLRRLDAAAFADWGGAFDKLKIEDLKFFHSGELVYLPGMHTSVGAEVWLGLTVFYRIDMNLKVGYAYGFSDEAVPGGQLYFISSSAF